jgi:hypothetical protein
MIDYTWLAAVSALSNQRIGASSTVRLLQNAATVARTSSMVTDYEHGAIPLLPVKAHLAVDVALCTVLIASPWFLPQSERRFAAIPMVLGIIGLVSSLLTDTRSRVETEADRGFSDPRDVTTTIDRDPDITAHPHLRAHLE